MRNLSIVELIHNNKRVSENLFIDDCSNVALRKNGGIEPSKLFESMITSEPIENVMGKFGIVPKRLLHEILMNLILVASVQNHTGTISEIPALEMSTSRRVF
jgi:hypothetical protein